jgi:hypothetical protein
MQRAVAVDAVLAQRAAVFQLLASGCKAQVAGVRGDAVFSVDLGFEGCDCAGGLDVKCDGVAAERAEERSRVHCLSCGYTIFASDESQDGSMAP